MMRGTAPFKRMVGRSLIKLFIIMSKHAQPKNTPTCLENANAALGNIYQTLGNPPCAYDEPIELAINGAILILKNDNKKLLNENQRLQIAINSARAQAIKDVANGLRRANKSENDGTEAAKAAAGILNNVADTLDILSADELLKTNPITVNV